jgi:hypothetical protein
MAGGLASARRRKSTTRFDGNVTRAVSTASKTAAESRRSRDNVIAMGTVGIAFFFFVVVGSSLVGILRPSL